MSIQHHLSRLGKFALAAVLGLFATAFLFQSAYVEPNFDLPGALPTLEAPPPIPTQHDLIFNSSPSTAWSNFVWPGVNITFGNLAWQEVDLVVSGRGPAFTFMRTYNSANTAVSSLGVGWTHSYNMSLTVESASALTISMPDGRLDRYTFSGGSWLPPTGIFNTLVENGDGTYTLTQKDQISYLFNADGTLAEFTDRNNNTMILTYSGGQLSQVTDASGRNYFLAYDTNGRLTSITDPAMRQVTYTYDANDRLETVTDLRSQVTTYSYDGNGRLTSRIDANSNALFTLTYDTEGRVSQSLDAENNLTTISYNFNIGQTAVTDPRDNTTLYGFDASYRFIGHEDLFGFFTYITYDSENNPLTVTNKRGNTTEFAYDGQGNVVQITDALEGTVTVTYNGFNDPISIINQRNFETQFEYDAQGNLLRITDPLSHITAFSYDQFGQVDEITDALGRVTPLSYDSLGNLDQMTDALLASTNFTYDLVGRLTGTVDPRSAATQFQYDDADNPTLVLDDQGNATHFTYDNVGNLLTTTDALSRTTTYTYDKRNLLISVTDPLDKETVSTYDGNGNLLTVTDPLSQTVSYTYDALNRLQVVEDGEGNQTTYAYDANGNQTTVTDPSDNNIIFTYDVMDRLVSTTSSMGFTTTYEYDAAGNQTAVIDANGNRTEYSYDALNRLIAVTDALGNVVQYEYDAVGNRTGVITAKGARTTYVYDPLNRLVQELDPLGNGSAYTYDQNGNRTAMVDAEGNTTTWLYDSLNRNIQINYPATAGVPASSVEFEYNAVGNRVVMTDTTGITTYTYDSLNRLTTLTNPIQETVTYTYDDSGRRVGLTYPDGSLVSYGYDAANRLTSVQDSTGTTTINYTPLGNRSAIHYANGVVGTYSYDEGNRLTGIYYESPQTGSLFFVEYVLDKVGNRLQMLDSEGLTTYEYDDLYRLTQVTYPDATWQSFTYDGNGNRLSLGDQDGTTTYTYDTADRLQTMVHDSNTTSFTWDANGNMTSKGDIQYFYDAANRLTKVVDGTNTYEYAYDGDGRRTQKSINDVVTTYLWDTLPSLPVILNESIGSEATEYVYADQLLAQIEPGGDLSYFHADGLGSTRALSSTNADNVGGYNYEAYGLVREEVGAQSTDFQFTGQQIDSETGLFYLRARFYDPKLGLFLSKDPLGPSSNLYTYSSNNPILYTDPTGNISCSTLCQNSFGFVKSFGKIGINAISASYNLTLGKDDIGATTNLIAGIDAIDEAFGYSGAIGQNVAAKFTGKAQTTNFQQYQLISGAIYNFGGKNAYNTYQNTIKVAETVSTAKAIITLPTSISNLSNNIKSLSSYQRLLSSNAISSASPWLNFYQNRKVLDFAFNSFSINEGLHGLYDWGNNVNSNHQNQPQNSSLSSIFSDGKMFAEYTNLHALYNGNAINVLNGFNLSKFADYQFALVPGPAFLLGISPERPSPFHDWAVGCPTYDWFVSYQSDPWPTLCITGNDPDADGYVFRIYSSLGEWTTEPVVNTSFDTSLLNLPYGTFSWEAAAVNVISEDLMLFSDWTDPWHFTKHDPSLTIERFDFDTSSPSNAETINIYACPSFDVSTTIRVLVNTATDGSASGEWIWVGEHGSCPEPTAEHPPLPWNTLPFADGTHLVRVEARDNSWNPPWTQVTAAEQTFTLLHRRPDKPSLIQPALNAWFTDRDITFVWSPTTNADSYQLCVGTAPGLPSCDLVNQTFDNTVTAYSTTLSDDYPDIYWTVTATNDVGSNGSAGGHFGIDPEPPYSAMGELLPTSASTAFVISWAGDDALSGIVNYDVLYKDGSNGIWQYWLYKTTETIALFTGEDGHTYYFQVIARDAAGNTEIITEDNGETFTTVDTSQALPSGWWNLDYKERRPLIILNRDNVAMPANYPVHLHFDDTTLPTAAELYHASQSTVKGDDLRIVFNDATELNRYILNFSETEIDIWFPAQVAIPTRTADGANYALYLANQSASTPPADRGVVFSLPNDASTRALYYMSENGGSSLIDASSFGNNGTIHSSVTYTETGKFGPALVFPDGNGERVNLGAPGSLNLTAMTVEGWFKINPQAGDQRIAGQLEGGGNIGDNKWLLWFKPDPGALAVSFWTPTQTNINLIANTTIDDTNWHYFAFTFNGSNSLKLYLDGVQVGEAITNGAWPAVNTTIELGTSEDINGMEGQLQMVRISSTVRTNFSQGFFAAITREPLSAAGGAQTIPDIVPTPTPTIPPTPSPTPSPSPYPWCASGYNQRIQITVFGQVTTPAGYPVQADISAIQSYFQSDGRDLRVYFWNGTACVELNRDYLPEASVVWFPLQTALSSGTSDDRYFLYLNNPNEGSTAPANPDQVYNWPGSEGSTQLLYHFAEASGSSTMDSSTNGYNGTLGAGITRPLGRFGRGVQLIRNNTGQITAATNTMGLASGLTIEAWVYRAPGGDLLAKPCGGCPSGWTYWLKLGAGGDSLGFEGLGTQVDTGISPSHYTWHHIAVTYDYTTVRFYVDGVLQYEEAAAGQNVDASGTLRIGGVDPGLANWTGKADEIRISNQAITDFSYVILPEDDPGVSLGDMEVFWIAPTSTPSATPTLSVTVTSTPTPSLTPTLGGTPTATPTMAPLEDFIVYMSPLNGIETLFKAEPDGSNPETLAGGDVPWHASFPRISPDNTKIAFEGYPGGDRFLWIMDADGSNKMQLYSEPINHARITWAADGSKIMFIGTDNIAYTIEPDGNNLTLISSWPTNYQPSAWCTNDRILAVYHNGVSDDIYTLDPDGSNITQLTTNSARDVHPDWSPDCSEIVFQSNRTGQYEIWKANPAGSNQSQLTTTPNGDWSIYPIWSADGQSILFSSSRDSEGYWDLFTMDASDGSNVVNITNTTDPEQWSDWSNAGLGEPEPTATPSSTPTPSLTPTPDQTPTFTPTPTPQSDWSEPVNISNDSGSSSYPTIIVQDDGTAHAVWCDSTPGNSDLFYATKPNGGQWTAAENVSQNSGNCHASSLLITSDGTIHVAWSDQTPGYFGIFYASNTNGTWSTPINVSGAGQAYNAGLVSDSNGVLHLVWWQAGAYAPFYAYKPAAAAWSAPVQIATGFSNISYTSLAISDDDTLHMVLQAQDHNGSAPNIYYLTKPTGGGWSGSTLISDCIGIASCAYADIETFNNDLHVIWHRTNNWPTDFDVIYSTRPDGGSWSAPVNLTNTSSDSFADNHGLAVDTAGNLNLVWEDNSSGAYEILYSDNRGGLWSAPENLSNTSTDSTQGSIATDPEGYVHLLWRDTVSGNSETYYLTNKPTLPPTPTVTPIPPTDTPTATSTPSSTPTFTPLPTDTPTATSTPSNTPTFTPLPTDTPTATSTPSNTPTFTPLPTDTPTATSTPSSTPTFTPLPTDTPTATSTPSNTPTFTPLPTDTPTATSTPSNTPTFTPLPTDTPTATSTPSSTPTFTPLPTDTPTATSTASSTATFTPLPTDTPTATSTPSSTPTFTPLPTDTPTASSTPSNTPTFTPMPTDTPTATSTPSSTPTFTPTPTSPPQVLTFNPVADASVLSNRATTNFGNSDNLSIDSSPVMNAYLRFNPQGISGTVTNATLRLYATTTHASGFNVVAVDNTSWGENTITYNNAPPLGSLIATSGPLAINSYVEIDITAYISGNQLFSLALVPIDTNRINLDSREGIHLPELMITAGSAPQPTETPTHTAVPTNTATVSPTATATNTGTSTPTNTSTPTPVGTATSTPLPTTTSTSTSTPVNTAVPTNTVTATSTATAADTNTPTPTSSSTATAVATATYTPAPPQMLTFYPVADASVLSNRPSTNFGGSASLSVDSSPLMYAFLRFDLQGLTGTPTNATLRLYSTSTHSTGFNLFAVGNTSWSESTITYNNAPTLGGLITTSGPVTFNNYIEIDITAYILGNGLVSLALSPIDADRINFDSREAVNIPELVITTGSAPQPTQTPTNTATSPPTSTFTPVPTNTSIPTIVGTATYTPTATPTSIATSTPTSTATSTITPTSLPTATPTPTDTPAPGQIVTFNPVADASVLSNRANNNFGGSTSLSVDTSPLMYAFLRFDLHGLTGNVSNATLRLYSTTTHPTGLNLFGVENTSWGESSITYNNAPPLGELITSSGPVTFNNYVEIDVTGYILGNGLVSIALSPLDADRINFDSREATHVPELIITTGN